MVVLSYKYQEGFVEIVGMKKGYAVIFQMILWYQVHTALAKVINSTKKRVDAHPNHLWDFL